MTCSRLPMMSWALRSKEVEMRISSKQRSNRKSCDLRECLMRTRRMHGWVECKIWTNEYYRGRNHKNYSWKSSLTCCQLNNTGRHQVSSLTTPSKLTWQPRKKRLEAVTLHIDIPRRFKKLKQTRLQDHYFSIETIYNEVLHAACNNVTM